MEDRKLVCKSDYEAEAAKAKGKNNKKCDILHYCFIIWAKIRGTNYIAESYQLYKFSISDKKNQTKKIK